MAPFSDAVSGPGDVTTDQCSDLALGLGDGKGVLIKSSVDDGITPLVFSSKSGLTYPKRAKSQDSSGAFLSPRNPKLVVTGLLLHIGSGVLAPDGSFFAKKTRRCTKNNALRRVFWGDFINTPFRCRSRALGQDRCDVLVAGEAQERQENHLGTEMNVPANEVFIRRVAVHLNAAGRKAG